MLVCYVRLDGDKRARALKAKEAKKADKEAKKTK
jgi:hypothetical protein